MVWQPITLRFWGSRRVLFFRKLEFSMILSLIREDALRLLLCHCLIYAVEFLCSLGTDSGVFRIDPGHYQAFVSTEPGRDLYKG